MGTIHLMALPQAGDKSSTFCCKGVTLGLPVNKACFFTSVTAFLGQRRQPVGIYGVGTMDEDAGHGRLVW